MPIATAADAPAVWLQGLVKRYGEVLAVDGLSLTVERGSVLALLGPNGAGKTTTIEVCEGFRRPDGGSVRVLGLDPVADRAALRPRVGAMLQSGGAYPAARAGEMLALVAAYYADPLPPAVLLDRLGLATATRTPYRRLSGGQQQRLSLAMAIVGRPELVFLDEPTAGLDPQARRATWELIGELRAAGVAVVLSTHYIEEAERLADRVVVVDRGRVVAEGRPAELTAAAGHGELRFRTRPGLDVGALAALCGGPVSEAAGLYRVRAPIDPQLLATVTAWCARQDALVQELHVAGSTLEDVFLELTGRELRS